ncbi:MAG: NADH-quinone oxidoreductase subunit C, partial [Candidatus Omnitrophica bacterium]|nr:NADH-quinone oxidoreductase subunit C [Candidatus Omnitrophota bacterium]
MKSLETTQKNIEQTTGVKLTLERDAFLVDRKDLIAVARFLKENESYKMDYVSCVTGVDYKEYLE